MSVQVDLTVRKFHASLNVSDLERSIAFYRVLFGIEPAKVRRDYAKFELSDPPVILSLIPGRKPANDAHINHVGLRVRTTDELVEVQRRLETAGIATKREEGVECCYAKQTKFWVTDPDRALWEIYVFHEDIDERGDATVLLAETTAQPLADARARTTWEHRLGDPIPEKIAHESDSVDEVSLRGTINVLRETANREAVIVEALRVLRPGSSIRIHGLAGDRPCERKPLALPGPAAAVEYVPASAEVADELARAGFVEVHLETLSETAYFNVDGVSMRELRVEARKPGHRPKQKTHYAIYRGPLAQVTDDFGNVFRRGELTALNVHDWQMLSASAARDAFLLVDQSPR